MSRLLRTLVAGAVLGGTGLPAQAIITYNLDEEFSGGDTPVGTFTATFDDAGCVGDPDGCVRLTMSTTSGGNAGEFINGGSNQFGWGFNLDPSLDPDDLAFAFVGGNNDADSISTGTNAFQADGDGLFDILFGWNANVGSRLVVGESAVYDITLTGLTEQSFNFSSVEGGGNGTFFSAAHVQGIGPDNEGSGFIGDGDGPGPGPGPTPIPEPGMLLILGTALAAAAFAGRRSGLR